MSLYVYASRKALWYTSNCTSFLCWEFIRLHQLREFRCVNINRQLIFVYVKNFLAANTSQRSCNESRKVMSVLSNRVFPLTLYLLVELQMRERKENTKKKNNTLFPAGKLVCLACLEGMPEATLAFNKCKSCHLKAFPRRSSISLRLYHFHMVYNKPHEKIFILKKPVSMREWTRR